MYSNTTVRIPIKVRSQPQKQIKLKLKPAYHKLILTLPA